MTPPRSSPRPIDPARLQEAEQLLRQGRFAEAEAAFRKLQRRAPRDPAPALGLAQAISMQGRIDDAIKALKPVAAVHTSLFAVQLVMADLHHQAGAADDALRHAEHAITSTPGSGDAHRLRALCLSRLNRVEEALAGVERALAIAPGDSSASILHGTLLRRTGALPEARSALERALTDPRLAPPARAEALHELGFVLDRLGEHDRAFEKFTAAGHLDEDIARRRQLDFEFAGRLVEQYRSGVRADVIAQKRTVTPLKKRPQIAFLVGFPRSGTTMTEQVLAAHPGIVTTDEQALLRPVRDAIAGDRQDVSDLAERLGGLDEKTIDRLRRAYWKEVDRQIRPAPGADVLVDKMPLNIVHLALINVVFPDAKVLVALRDPRDVCLSCFMQAFPLNTGMIQFVSLERTVAYYAAVMSLWQHLAPMLTIPYLEVRYEDTVRDLPATARRILDHLGCEWTDDVLAFHEKARERLIRTPSAVAVTEPVNTRAIGRWASYRSRMAAVMPTLEPFVRAFGYDSE